MWSWALERGTHYKSRWKKLPLNTSKQSPHLRILRLIIRRLSGNVYVIAKSDITGSTTFLQKTDSKRNYVWNWYSETRQLLDKLFIPSFLIWTPLRSLLSNKYIVITFLITKSMTIRKITGSLLHILKMNEFTIFVFKFSLIIFFFY